MKALLALTSDTPAELAAPVEAALVAEGFEVLRADLGKVSGGNRVLDRVMGAILGEVEARKLTRELVGWAPDVTVALDPAGAVALVRERDGGAARPVPVVGVVSELAPRPAWAVDADRYTAIDDEAAVALGERGVDGARVEVVGAPVRHAQAEAGKVERSELRARFKLPAGEAVILVECASLGSHELGQLLLQLALVDGKPVYLFEAPGDGEAASILRRQVPTLGLRGKLFGKSEDAPLYWRAAEVVVARPRPRAVLGALAAGCAFVAIEPQGEREQAEARALEERGIGAATKILLASSTISPLARDARIRAAAATAAERRGRPGGGDAAAAIARLCREVAEHREAVLAETRAAAAERGLAEERRAAPAGDLEDLDGGFEDLGGGEAGSEPEPPIAAPPPPPRRSVDDEIDAMKREQARRASSVDDELAALKKKMQGEGKKR